MAIVFTVLSALGLKEVSRAPVEVSLAILFLAVPHIVVKSPQIIICPSDCRAIVLTVKLALGLKEVSIVPSLLNLEILFLATPQIVV
jgi:hypothetical protein